MELHQLRYLRAVVRTGGVTAAAELEHVAQPNVSKQVKLLEREIGTPLLHRVGRRVVPTEAGRALAACAGRVLDDIETTVAEISGEHAALAQHLSICATETVSDYLLPAALARLRREHPAARVSAEMLGTDDAVLRLLSDTIDLAIVALPLRDPRLEVTTLFEEDVMLVVPEGHPLAKRRNVALGEALREPALLFSMPGVGLRALIDGAARDNHVALEPALQLRSQRALMEMVALGGGVTFAPSIAARGFPGTVALALDPPLRRQVGWARRPGRHLGPIAFALLEGVQAEGRARSAEVS